MMELLNLKILLSIAYCMLILPLLVALVNIRYLKNEFLLLVIYLFVSLVTEILSSMLEARGISNIPLFNVYSLVEYSLWLFFYCFILQGFIRKRPLMIVTGILLMVFGTLAFVFYSMHEINNLLWGIGNLVIIVFSILFFYRIMKEMTIPAIHKYPLFWINTANLFYFSGSFFIFLFSKKLLNLPIEINELFWSLHLIIVIIADIFYSVGLWQIRYQKALPSLY